MGVNLAKPDTIRSDDARSMVRFRYSILETLNALS